MRRFYSWFLRILITRVDRGADTSVFAATSPVVRAKAEQYKGAYPVPVGKIAKLNANAQNPQLAKDLRETLERQLACLE
jgi:hypothetical protein